MKFLDNSKVVYYMSKNNKAVITISSGESIEVQTFDCFKNQLLDNSATLNTIDFNTVNPATGPIEIEGAKAGDGLKIEVLDIEFDDIGCTGIGNTFGVLKEKVKNSLIRRINVSKDSIEFSDKLKLRLRPMIGVIGVAPRDEDVKTDTPSNHGGNMDCTLITKGAILYLPVFVDGGLLSLGDLHSAMGDGEIGGCGLETSGKVKLKISIVKNYNINFPVVVNKDKISVLASEPTVEQAYKKAVENMHEYLLKTTNLNSDDAIILQSLSSDLSICQAVNPNKTVRMSFPKDYAQAYGYIED